VAGGPCRPRCVCLRRLRQILVIRYTFHHIELNETEPAPTCTLWSAMKAALALVALAATSAHAATITVQTPSGPIVGESNGDVDVFRGVPYAEQPVGGLRWQPTVPVKGWTSPLQATQDAPGCPQACALPPHTCPPTTSEACLFLNIFAPHGATKAPVMIFMHGGNFKQVRCVGRMPW
jgi:para-nitrobenzyl esterase